MLDVVTVLGVKYRIHLHVKKADKPILQDYDAVTDTSTKDIYIADFVPDDHSLDDLAEYTRKTLRHELTHAFLYESGLDANSDWARNEEIIDWIAIQYPKMNQIFTQIEV